MSNRTARSRFNIRQNDDDPPIDDTLQDEDGNTVDLTTINSVNFHMEASDGTVKVNAAASVTDGANGKVEYQWSGTDTDTVGWYKATWEVEYSDTDKETFPTGTEKDYIVVRVESESA